VIDGQHRLAAARIRGDIDHLPAVVGSYASTADEAANFVHLNQQRRPLGKLDLFKAAVASGDTEATEIVAALEAAGLSVAPHMNPISWAPARSATSVASRPAGGAMGPTSPGWRSARCAKASTARSCSMPQHLPAVVSAEARQFRPAFTDKSWAALIAMIRSKTQDEWRSAMLMARAHDPNLTLPKASEKVLLDAWDADADTLIGPAALRPGARCIDCQAQRTAPPPRRRPCAQAARRSRPGCSPRESRLVICSIGARRAEGSACAKPPRSRLPRCLGRERPSRFIPGPDRKAWCSQCDRRVSAGELASCKDRFCAFQRNS
jgi:hypothetical protein